jgi:hypothetical protein
MFNKFIMCSYFIVCLHFTYCLSPISLSQSHTSFQHTHPIRHTAYIYSHMHQFQYISITYVALYISSIYWHHQKRLINKFKWVTYSIICMYIYILLQFYKITL